MQASFVEGTNLVMVWISQDKASDNCYDETQCPKTEPSEVPFGFEPIIGEDFSDQCDGVAHSKSKRSQSMCYNTVQEIGPVPCSPAAALMASTFSFILLALRV